MALLPAQRIMKPKSNKNPYYRNQEPTKLNSALDQMFDVYKIKGKADQTTIISLWEELMGKTIASRTTKLFFRGNVLNVQLSSAPLRQELTLAKDKILKMFAEKVGSHAIDDIVFR